MKTKRAVIVQCRLSSTRLPEKAIKKLGDKVVLGWVLSAMHKVSADRYFVATDEASYETLKPICDEYGFECFAGDLNNVLKRFCDLMEKIKAEIIIRATADNPFLFYEAAEASVIDFEERNKTKHTVDYLTYSGLPHGSGVEIFSGKSLLEAAANTQDPYDLEHVGPALYNHKDKYRCEFVKAPSRFNFPELRTTIDTYSDFLRAVSIVNYLSLKSKTAPYSTEQIVEACNSIYVKNPVVYVPSVEKGHGTGHLHRCLSAAVESKQFVYIPDNSSLLETSKIIDEYFEKGLEKYQIINELPDETFSPVIVTDYFQLSEELAVKYSKAKALISIDEGSQFSSFSDYLLDIIPSYKSTREPNLFDTSFIKKPENVRNSKVNEYENILVCIGGEDPAGLTIPAANYLSKLFPSSKITAVINGDIKKTTGGKENIDNILYVGPIQNLKEKLYEYDLVVTHYGLTAFEAIFAGCPVILLATTKLHENLADKYGFAYIPENGLSEKTVFEAIRSSKLYPELPLSHEQKPLGLFIKSIAEGKKMLCPVCQKEKETPDSIVSRNASRTYRRCSACGLVYMAYTTEADKSYEKAYFFEDYKKQYGKTYQEDFENIKKQCLRRVAVMNTLQSSESTKNVLDIGCAYGPFLSAASDSGLNPFGTDISEDAVEFVKNDLHFPASCSAFPQIDTASEFGISQFDLVSMWYVIEHFKNLDSVLSKVNSILKKGGVFAFSTPSGEGVSAKSDKDHFYQISPTDHYSIWEPSKAQKVLQKYGFKIEKIVSTGHHPERFPSIKKTDAKPGSLKWKVVEKISHMKNLGDTVEIYCKKISEI